MKIVLYIYGNTLGPERGCSDKCSSDTQKKMKQFELPALRTNAEYMHLNITLLTGAAQNCTRYRALNRHCSLNLPQL